MSSMANSSTVPGMTNTRLWLVLGSLMLSVLLASMEISIIATALPTIAGEFNAFNQFAWVGTAYIAAAAISTPLLGRFSDIYGRRMILQVALGLFIVGSLLCGLSQSMNQLIGFRGHPGVRRRRDPGAGIRRARRHPPAPRARTVHRLLHAGLRRRGAVRSADRRLHHRTVVVAVDLLHQRPARRDRGRRQLVRPRSAVPAPPRAHRRCRRAAARRDDRLARHRPRGRRHPRLDRPAGGRRSRPLSGRARRIRPRRAAGRRADDPAAPVLNRVVLTCVVAGSCAGAITFGAGQFLPLYFQDSLFVSPTESGLRLLPR